MERNGDDLSEVRDSAASLWKRAAQVRRLMKELTAATDRDRLRQYAEKLEAQAREVERDGR